MSDLETREVNTFSVETPSLDGLGMEPVHVEIIRDLLRDQWRDSTQVPRPEIHCLNDTTFPGQAQLRNGDWIVTVLDNYSESQRGFTYEFKDVEISLSIDIRTAVSRQRLYNLMAEVRRIIYKNHIAVRPYQMIYWDNFEEDSDGLQKMWIGLAHIRLTAEGVPVFKGFVDGMGSENAPENQR